MEQIKLAIFGYGNLGKGVAAATAQNSDIRLTGIFTRRDPASVQAEGIPVYAADALKQHLSEIDVLVICGGSATDLPVLTPALAGLCNVLDSFDTHANIPAHFAAVDAAARQTDHAALISGGWDPGLFSLARLYGSAILPEGNSETFWGRGVSQGHSDALRRIPGVLDARQYTVPVQAALESVRRGENRTLTPRDKHTRECYIVAEPGADLSRIENDVKTMPNYFADYDTTVHFISREELRKNHAALPHGGTVIRNGVTGTARENGETVEFKLTLDSNPEFTGSVLVALARGLCRMYRRGVRGCQTVFDVAPADLSPLSREEMIAKML